MTTVYATNYATGRDDKASGSKCRMPSSLPDPTAFRGYMDGYGGNVFNEPKAQGIVYMPKYFIT